LAGIEIDPQGADKITIELSLVVRRAVPLELEEASMPDINSLTFARLNPWVVKKD
jgi:hypothetical protein